MTPEGVVTGELGKLVYDATCSPETVNLQELISAADAALRVAPDSDDELLSAYRAMALAAWEWALFGGANSHIRMDNATRSWFMLWSLAELADN